MAWRLLVVDGADQGRFFPLADAGMLTIGNSHKHADICLHDLYVGRVHCQVAVADGHVVAVEVDPARTTYVNGQRITQQEIRAGDVLRVGNSHLRLEVHDGTAPEAPEEPEPPARLPHLPLERLGQLSGHRLSHYELGAVLGRGYTGVVFRAFDLKAEQPVALKVLSPEFPAGAAEMLQFARALKAVLPLRHPHIVGVLGAGKTGPYCWVALELVEGDSLAQVMDQKAGKGSWKQALRLALHLGRALDCAYQHRLIHGNLTPRNVLISATHKQARLGDLVLGKALENSHLQLDVLETKLLDELPYLAPEQMPGEGTVDYCTDLYGLGAVVYTRLTGRPPFEAAAPEDTIHMIRAAPPVRPREHLDSVPAPFEGLVLRLLAKRPEERFLTPAELLGELEPLARQHGVKD
jgi:serine/threonine-protein kinase